MAGQLPVTNFPHLDTIFTTHEYFAEWPRILACNLLSALDKLPKFLFYFVWQDEREIERKETPGDFYYDIFDSFFYPTLTTY